MKLFNTAKYLILVLTFLGISLGSFIFASPAQAASRNPGCYVHNATEWQQIGCDDLKAVWPAFAPAGEKCYFSWGTGFGPTPPVEIACGNAPENGAQIILPKDNQPGSTSDGSATGNSGPLPPPPGADECGTDAVRLSVNIGCTGEGNAILDMVFAFIRFLSLGVGIVIIGSVIVAGIQYTTSAGDPSATAKAIERIRNTGAALLLYFFIFAILNWLIPGGVF